MELASLGASIGAGLAVAILVEAIVLLRVRVQQRRAVLDIKAVMLGGEEKILSAQESITVRGDPGIDGTIVRREQIQAAYWNEYLDTARSAIESRASALKPNHFMEFMDIINGLARITRLAETNGIILESQFYEQHFAKLRDRLENLS